MNNILKTAVKFSLVITSICYTSCINSNQSFTEEPPIPSDSIKIPINISGQILQAEIYSRATDNSFEDGDAIGLYVLEQPETLDGKRHINNMRFIYSSSSFTPDEDIYYPKGDRNCNFISYYPYQDEGFREGSSKIKVKINPDQNLATEYSKSDFMIATTNDITASKKAINLEHNHKLCQLNLILQLNPEEDIDALQKDAIISINNLKTEADYDIYTEVFSNFNLSQNINPNGQWIINKENNQLTGKRALIIPQPTTDCELILHTTSNKVYSTVIPAELILESGTSCELTLNYDSRIGIKGITSTIGAWQPGNSGNATFEEIEEQDVINIADLNFNQSNVYDLKTSSDVHIGEICKEYLKNADINSQAIVLYTDKEKNKGIVLQLLGQSENVHGGIVTWDMENNSFTYQPGSKSPIQCIYIDKEGNIIFDKSDNLQTVFVAEKMLVDKRGSETINYPIVKIGTQYWMRENLSTQKYNDGSAITNNTSDLKKSTAGYYFRDGNYFYNKAGVITGKMAPLGWKIPNDLEWEDLKKYINDEAAVLKTGIWTEIAGITKANNLAFFNGKAIGSYYTSVSPTSYGGKSEYVSYWKIGDTPTSLFQYGVTLTYKENIVKGALYSDYCAYAIRCIKE